MRTIEVVKAESEYLVRNGQELATPQETILTPGQEETISNKQFMDGLFEAVEIRNSGDKGKTIPQIRKESGLLPR